MTWEMTIRVNFDTPSPAEALKWSCLGDREQPGTSVKKTLIQSQSRSTQDTPLKNPEFFLAN